MSDTDRHVHFYEHENPEEQDRVGDSDPYGVLVFRAVAMSARQEGMPGERLVECPACGLPAEIIDRFMIDGSPSPVEHVKLMCVVRHWFTAPTDSLPGGQQSPVAKAARAQSLTRAERQRNLIFLLASDARRRHSS